MDACNDPKCPIHGSLSVRGNLIEGKVVRARAPKTVLVERELIKYIPKYERYRKVRSRIAAYCPDCMDIKEGDMVRIGETRKLSKTKSFAVLAKVLAMESKTQKGEKKK